MLMLIAKKYFIILNVLLISFSLWIMPVLASVQIDGQFKANKSCQALQSIRMGTNPDNIHLIKDKIYQVIGKDRHNESHYLIKMDNIKPPMRWVAKNCGQFINK